MATSQTQAGHAGKSGFVVDGIDLVTRDFRIAADTLGPAADAVLVIEARELGEAMKRHAPVASGKTRDSVTADEHATHDDHGSWIEVGPEHFVARFDEYGTARMAPRSFVEPATAERSDDFERAISDLHARLWR